MFKDGMQTLDSLVCNKCRNSALYLP